MITEDERKSWANSNLRKRANFGGKVYELNDNGVVYVLERETSAPNKEGQSGFLNLIEAIPQPTETLLTEIDQHNEM